MIWYIFDQENSLWKLKFHVFEGFAVIQWKSYEKINSELETAWISMIFWIPQDL